MKIGRRLKSTSCEERIEGRASVLSRNNRNINAINGKQAHVISASELLYEMISQCIPTVGLYRTVYEQPGTTRSLPRKERGKEGQISCKGTASHDRNWAALPPHAMQPKTDSK